MFWMNPADVDGPGIVSTFTCLLIVDMRIGRQGLVHLVLQDHTQGAEATLVVRTWAGSSSVIDLSDFRWLCVTHEDVTGGM
jgi:hypothetical protein